MKRTRSRLVVVFVSIGAGAAGILGCGRHVVLAPETVERLNDRAWTLKSEPRAAAVIVVDGGASPVVDRGTVP